MKLLHIDASILGPNSVSRRLTSELVGALVETDPSLEVTYRDLAADAISHFDSNAMAVRADNEILREFLDADVLVIGAPMYNFGICSQLKAWFDHIIVAGKTFRYGPNGPEGLAGGKVVYLAIARGGVFAPGAPYAAFDFQEPYLKALLTFIGVERVTIVRAEGLSMGPEQRAASIDAAIASVSAVVGEYAAG